MDKSKLAVALFNGHAEAYQTKYLNIKQYEHTLDVFSEAIALEKANILELACGPGNLTKYLLTQKSQWTVLGTDLSPKMLLIQVKD